MNIVTQEKALSFVTVMVGEEAVGADRNGDEILRYVSPIVVAHLSAAVGFLTTGDDVWRRLNGKSLTPERAQKAQNLIDFLDAVATTLKACKPEERAEVRAALGENA